MKKAQIEQKAKEIAANLGACPECVDMEGVAMEMAYWALSHQWVSVEDELPKDGELVMTTFIDYKGKRRYATGKKMATGMQVYGIISPSPMPSVTHWMHIPPLAEEGGEEK